MRGIVERCARGAALAAGVEVAISARRGYKDMRNNLPLARAFGRHLERLGRTPRERDPRAWEQAAPDMGDVSHVVCAIHPWLAICDEGAAQCHQRTFAASAASDRGVDSMLIAAKALANSAADFIRDPELQRASRAAFERGDEV